jgi:hypothetical protein
MNHQRGNYLYELTSIEKISPINLIKLLFYAIITIEMAKNAIFRVKNKITT